MTDRLLDSLNKLEKLTGIPVRPPAEPQHHIEEFTINLRLGVDARFIRGGPVTRDEPSERDHYEVWRIRASTKDGWEDVTDLFTGLGLIEAVEAELDKELGE